MTIVLCTLIVLLAFVGEATFGFGGGLLAVPLLSLVIDVRDAVVLTSLFQFLIGFLVFRDWSKVAWRIAAPVAYGMCAGVIIGAYSLPLVSEIVLRWILAVFILLFLVRAIVFPSWGILKPSLLLGGASGLLSGFFQGCIGTGGPNLVIYLRNLLPDREVFRATLIMLLSLANLLRIPVNAQADLFTPAIQALTLWILPFFIIGIAAGQRFHRVVPEKVYFHSVYFLLFVSAVSLIWKNVAQG